MCQGPDKQHLWPERAVKEVETDHNTAQAGAKSLELT